MIERQARIALLIDADNSPSSKIDVILAELAKVGVANIRRAYGNWKKNELRGWEDALHEYAIRPVQQFDYSKGKNATDMVMVIEALDLLYTDRPDAFGIVSSDADFTPLVMHLRAKGALVFGFGAKKTPLPFVNACSRFLYLENLGDVAAPLSAEPEAKVLVAPAAAAVPAKKAAARKRAGGATKAAALVTSAAPKPDALAAAADAAFADVRAESQPDAAPLKQDSAALRRDGRLVALLRHAVDNAAGEDGWSPLGSVGQQIGNQASFDPRNYGYRKLIDLIEATQLFELDRRGTQFVLRGKRVGRTPRGG
jgi:uncharacterized LabA/DUF88 family protein